MSYIKFQLNLLQNINQELFKVEYLIKLSQYFRNLAEEVMRSYSKTFFSEAFKVLADFNPIQARLFLLFKGPGGVFRDPLTISGTIKSSPMKLCTGIVLRKAYQNTKRNFEKYDL